MKTTLAAVLTLAMALPGVAQQVPDYVSTDGLMGWWPLTGTLEDQSSQGHDAQNFGAVFTSDRHGVENAALHFDGEGWMESLVPQTEAWTVSIWALQEDAATYNGLIQHKNNCVRGAGWLVTLPGNDGVRLARQNCGECSPSTCNAALDETIPLPGDGHAWNHIAATCNSEGFFQLFVNGQLVQEWTDASTVGVYGSQLLSVGKHHDGTTYLPLVGSADDIGLWSRVLTSEEILALYNAPALIPGCTSLEACNYNPEANLEDGSCFTPEQCADLQVPSYVPAEGLVGWFPFADGAISSQVGEESVQIEGAISSADRFGNLNQAHSFNGQNDFVSIEPLGDAYNYEGQNQISISTWVKPTEFGAQFGLVGYSGYNDAYPQYALKIESTGRMYFIAGSSLFEENGFNLSASTLDLGEWNHMVMTYDGALLTFYLNGSVEFENPIEDTFSGANANAKLFFGKAWGQNNASLQGSMDDVGIWNRSLSEVEVAALYYAGTPSFGCLDAVACNYDPDAIADDGSCLYLPEASLASNVGVSPEGLLTVSVPGGLDAWEWNDGSVAASRAIAPFQEYVLTGSVGVAPEVGQVTEEGIVFHVDEEEQWALLASPSSIGSGVEWGCKFVTTGAVGSALGEGASNTAMILEACDDPMAAARVASEYGDGWFLPSMDELGAIYEHVHAAGLGEYFVDNTYNWFWSSTECATDGTAAGDIWFQNGDAHACNNKDSNPGGVIAAKRLDYAQCTYTDTLYVALGATPPVCGPGTVWDEASHSCVVAYPSDTDFDGCVTMTDLLDLLTVFGSCMEAEVVEWSCGDPLNYQGYDYETVLIGEQCWFAENLRAKSYQNGDDMLLDLSQTDWQTTNEGATSSYGLLFEDGGYCDNQSTVTDMCDPETTESVFGLLYNGHAIQDDRLLCPSGWVVPTNEQFLGLIQEAGGIASGAPALCSETGWNPGANGTDATGFKALPGGYHTFNGDYNYGGRYAYFWTIDGPFWTIKDGVTFSSAVNSANNGFSVRCIQE